MLTTRMILSITMAVAALPFVFFVKPPSHELWQALIVSVIVHWAYQWAMIRALHRGDLSLVFPVMRGAGPLLTALFAFLILGEQLTSLQMVGLITASAGVIFFAIPEKVSEDAKHLNRVALFYAVLTGIGVGAYSAVDARAIRIAEIPYTFIVWLFLLDWIGVTIVTLFARRGRVTDVIRAQWKDGVSAGLLGAASFSLILYAFTLTNVATVTALRETAVVFGAILGWLFLKESFGLRRILSASVIAAGLVMMQLAA